MINFIKTKILKRGDRNLSFARLGLILLIISAVGYYSFFRVKTYTEKLSSPIRKAWFAPFVDVTIVPQFHFEQPEVAKINKNLILSFVVSSQSDPCQPSWGSAYSLDEANTKIDLDRRIARYRQLGGDVSVSFGGEINSELAILCTDENKLLNAYQSVINRYNLNTLDFDLEGLNYGNEEVLNRRFSVLAKIQKEYAKRGKHLAIWLTLPVSTAGMTPDGIAALSTALKNELDVSGINAMTMNYGQSKNSADSMSDATIQALKETHRQMTIVYQQHNINLHDHSVWQKIGFTPMIGQNNDSGQVFTLDDAQKLVEFAKQNSLTRGSFWSLNRDIACGENYINVEIASNSCSGVKQDKYAFSAIFSANLDGNLFLDSSRVTTQDPLEEKKPDDPALSPYPIWKENETYLQGYRVVWHHVVYEAKWWTKGDLPDNPTLQNWQTPWKIIGPVLPGDKPLPLPSLPAKFYPDWSGTETYEGGQRVMFNGVPYQAKWWTKGDSPEATMSTPESSPWIALTREQISEILKSQPKPSKTP